MRGYGWTVYDTRTGGSQTLHDTELQLDLTTDFIKSEDGSSWAARIVGAPKPGSSKMETSVILHVAVERADSAQQKSLVCEGQENENNGVYAHCLGDSPALGAFDLQVYGDAKNRVLHDTAVKSIQVPEEKIWQAKGKSQISSPATSILTVPQPCLQTKSGLPLGNKSSSKMRQGLEICTLFSSYSKARSR